MVNLVSEEVVEESDLKEEDFDIMRSSDERD